MFVIQYFGFAGFVGGIGGIIWGGNRCKKLHPNGAPISKHIHYRAVGMIAGMFGGIFLPAIFLLCRVNNHIITKEHEREMEVLIRAGLIDPGGYDRNTFD